MDYRPFANTGIQVSPLCLGGMMFGQMGNPDHEDGTRIIHRALDAGINFIDTADVYSGGESEEIIGKALADGRRDDVILATKVYGPMGGVNRSGISRRWIIAEVEESLRRLSTDYIDLYQIHRPDPGTDLEETLGALTDLVRAGKVRYIGTSTFPPSRMVEAQWVSHSRHLERVVCEQPPYSMLTRGIEHDMLPTARRHRMAVIAWSPLSGGWLSGKWRKGRSTPGSTRAAIIPHTYDMSLPANQHKLDIVEQLAELAESAGMTLIEMALRFVLSHPTVTSAIIGPRTMEHLDSQLGGASGQLDADLLDRIDEIVPPGTNTVSADAGWEEPDLSPEARRRPLVHAHESRD